MKRHNMIWGLKNTNGPYLSSDSPTHLLTLLVTYPPACSFTHPLNCLLHFQPTWLPTHPSTNLPAYLPAGLQYNVVNNAIYASYLQHARHEALAALGFDADGFARAGTPLALSELNMTFRAPLRWAGGGCLG